MSLWRIYVSDIKKATPALTNVLFLKDCIQEKLLFNSFREQLKNTLQKIDIFGCQIYANLNETSIVRRKIICLATINKYLSTVRTIIEWNCKNVYLLTIMYGICRVHEGNYIKKSTDIETLNINIEYCLTELAKYTSISETV